MSPRVIVTRPASQAGELVTLLEERGVEAVSVPAVEIAADDGAALDAALATLDGADWLVVTSANGASVVVDRLTASGRRLPAATRVAAVGPATADVLRGGGVPVHHVPSRYLTVAIAEELGPVAGSRVVLARADAATPELHEALVARGARVEEVVAYRTIEGPTSSRPALQAALSTPLDGITFTSGSTVRGIGRLLADVSDEPGDLVRRLPAFCIGPVTARAAHEAGWSLAGVADEHTALGLANVIAAHFSAREAFHT
jgi:uroporphyrinogen-III synthase